MTLYGGEATASNTVYRHLVWTMVHGMLIFAQVKKIEDVVYDLSLRNLIPRET